MEVGYSVPSGYLLGSSVFLVRTEGSCLILKGVSLTGEETVADDKTDLYFYMGVPLPSHGKDLCSETVGRRVSGFLDHTVEITHLTSLSHV